MCHNHGTMANSSENYKIHLTIIKKAKIHRQFKKKKYINNKWSMLICYIYGLVQIYIFVLSHQWTKYFATRYRWYILQRIETMESFEYIFLMIFHLWRATHYYLTIYLLHLFEILVTNTNYLLRNNNITSYDFQYF